MASDLKKVNNPKEILLGIRYQLEQIWLNMMQKSRLNVFL
jgi:hypothetical protein